VTRFVDEKDIAILRVIDGLRTAFEWVPIEKIIEKLPYKEFEVKRRIKELEKMNLTRYRYVSHYNSFAAMLTEKGFDTLALWDFKKHDVIEKVGAEVGVGKESIIVGCINPKGEWVVVKFHRYWAKEFRNIRKSLAYASIVVRGKELNLEDSRIDIPRAKAQVEMNALEKLHKIGINVPKPLGINRHAIAMKMLTRNGGIPAPQLVRVKLTDPITMYETVIEDYIKMAKEGDVIHGDFNEYNIIITEDETPYYIDFPQSVPKTYPEAKFLIRRDLNKISHYFQTKYRLKTKDTEKILTNLMKE